MSNEMLVILVGVVSLLSALVGGGMIYLLLSARGQQQAEQERERARVEREEAIKTLEQAVREEVGGQLSAGLAEFAQAMEENRLKQVVKAIELGTLSRMVMVEELQLKALKRVLIEATEADPDLAALLRRSDVQEQLPARAEFESVAEAPVGGATAEPAPPEARAEVTAPAAAPAGDGATPAPAPESAFAEPEAAVAEAAVAEAAVEALSEADDGAARSVEGAPAEPEAPPEASAEPVPAAADEGAMVEMATAAPATETGVAPVDASELSTAGALEGPGPGVAPEAPAESAQALAGDAGQPEPGV